MQVVFHPDFDPPKQRKEFRQHKVVRYSALQVHQLLLTALENVRIVDDSQHFRPTGQCGSLHQLAQPVPVLAHVAHFHRKAPCQPVFRIQVVSETVGTVVRQLFVGGITAFYGAIASQGNLADVNQRVGKRGAHELIQPLQFTGIAAVTSLYLPTPLRIREITVQIGCSFLDNAPVRRVPIEFTGSQRVGRENHSRA